MLPFPWSKFSAVTYPFLLHGVLVPWIACLVALIAWAESGYRWISYYESLVFPCCFLLPVLNGFGITLRLITDPHGARAQAFAVMHDCFSHELDFMDRAVDGERAFQLSQRAGTQPQVKIDVAMPTPSGSSNLPSPTAVFAAAGLVPRSAPTISGSVMAWPSGSAISPVITNPRSVEDPQLAAAISTAPAPLSADVKSADGPVSNGTNPAITNGRSTVRASLRRLLEHWYDRTDTTVTSFVDSQLKKVGLERSHPHSHSTGGSKLLEWRAERILCLVAALIGAVSVVFIARPIISGSDHIFVVAGNDLTDRQYHASVVLVLASVVAGWLMLFALLDAFIRAPAYWLNILDQDRKLLNSSCIFPSPNLVMRWSPLFTRRFYMHRL
jgi:hypothetical protein